ncbi:MAG: hypothetical protein Q4D76_19475, partial [Oscillospiraceae bacterium]|nr:hypothetical protein [Oscillospiraceae bacterium]
VNYAELKNEVTVLKEDVAELKVNYAELKNEVTVLKDNVEELNENGAITRGALNTLVEWAEIASVALGIRYPVNG